MLPKLTHQSVSWLGRGSECDFLALWEWIELGGLWVSLQKCSEPISLLFIMNRRCEYKVLLLEISELTMSVKANCSVAESGTSRHDHQVEGISLDPAHIVSSNHNALLEFSSCLIDELGK